MSERLTDEQLRHYVDNLPKGGVWQIMATELIALRAQVATLTEKLRNTDAALDATYGAEIRLEEREAEMVVALAQVAALREALKDIAKQRRPFEMDEDQREHADLEAGYDGCVGRARAALEMSGRVK